MVSLTNERALEIAIEKVLTGTCLENVKAGLTDITLGTSLYLFPILYWCYYVSQLSTRSLF